MARTALTVNQLSIAGVTHSPASANADGHSLENIKGDTILFVVNGGGAPITVTIQTPGKFQGLDIEEQEITVGNGVTKVIGPFRPTGVYNNSTGVFVDFSGVTSVTVAAYKL